jgi:hypothetical protein
VHPKPPWLGRLGSAMHVIPAVSVTSALNLPFTPPCDDPSLDRLASFLEGAPERVEVALAEQDEAHHLD